MVAQIKRRLVLTEAVLLVIFSTLGCAYLLFTLPLNAEQYRLVLTVAVVGSLLIGLPMIVTQPAFRGVERDARRLEAGEFLPPERVQRHLRRVLSYPVKASFGCFVPTVLAYGIGALVARKAVALPIECVVISMIVGVVAGLLWGAVEYFLAEHFVRPLTKIGTMGGMVRPKIRQLSLSLKIFFTSLVLVTASLGVFGVTAYTRAARIVEEQVGEKLKSVVIEIGNLTAELPPSETGELSDLWWTLATEYRVSPRGYIHLIDREGKLLRTHPATEALDKSTLADEGFLASTTRQILEGREAITVDRVGQPRVIAYSVVPDSAWKLVAIAPRSDFNIYLNHFLYSGAAAMGFSILIVLFIGSLSARSITTALGRVTEAARGVAEQRDLSRRVNFLTNDEVGVLASAFNEMAGTLQSYAEGLEHLVAERTRELALRSEQLEQKNVEMKDFLYVVSHDLRAPLINLEGFSRSLQDTTGALEELVGQVIRASSNGDGGELAEQWSGIKEEIGESVGFILQSVAKMDMLARALLELSRIETRPHMPTRIDTRNMLNDIVGSLQYQISDRGIAVSIGDLPSIYGDSLRINQVFTNLIDNAIKYMKPEGDKRIHVGCEEHEGFYHFFVRDTGPGIRPEDQQKVFRLFARLVTQKVPGDGVGLAAVKKIVEKHGGRIWLESTVGVGSTFWFSVPKPPSDAGVAGRKEEDVRQGADHDLDG